MTPEELSSWPERLFAVEIRQNNINNPIINNNMLSPMNINNYNNNNKIPLQDISCFNDYQNR